MALWKFRATSSSTSTGHLHKFDLLRLKTRPPWPFPYEGGGTAARHLSLIPEAVYVTYDRPPSFLLGRVRIVRRNVRGNRSPALSPFGPFIGHLACLLTRYPCHTVTLMALLLPRPQLAHSRISWRFSRLAFRAPRVFLDLYAQLCRKVSTYVCAIL